MPGMNARGGSRSASIRSRSLVSCGEKSALVMALFSQPQNANAWARRCSVPRPRSRKRTRVMRKGLIVTSRELITLTSAEVYALAERLRARATSVVLRDAPSQQSDGILAAGALLHLVAELKTLRGGIERAASSTSNVAGHLRELLDDRGAQHRGSVTIRFD